MRTKNKISFLDLLNENLRENPVYAKLFEATSKIIDEQIGEPLSQLARIRSSTHIKRGDYLEYEPGKTGKVAHVKRTIVDNEVTDEITLSLAFGSGLKITRRALQDRRILVNQSVYSGFDYYSDYISDDDYGRIVDYVNEYWSSGGAETPDFINFIGFIKNLRLEMIPLWSSDYKLAEPEQLPPPVDPDEGFDPGPDPEEETDTETGEEGEEEQPPEEEIPEEETPDPENPENPEEPEEPENPEEPEEPGEENPDPEIPEEPVPDEEDNSYYEEEYPYFIPVENVTNPAYKGGTEFLTSHVDIEYDLLTNANPNFSDLINLFYYFAPIHLVLRNLIGRLDIQTGYSMRTVGDVFLMDSGYCKIE